MMAKKLKEPTNSPAFLYGFKKLDHDVVIAPRFDFVYEFVNGYSRTQLNRLWGLINEQGEWVVQPQFQWIGNVENSHFPFRMNNLWGVADLSGKIVLPAQYEEIIAMGQSVITVKEGSKFKIIRMDGTVIKEDLNRAFGWNSGFSVVEVDGLTGMLDEKGNWLVGPRSEPVYDFSEGLAAIEENGKAGFMNLQGQIVIPFQFDAAYDFSEGLARVRLDNRFGYIDYEGRLVIPCEWWDGTQILLQKYPDSDTAFKNGLAISARLLSGAENTGFCERGYIDRLGNWYPIDQPPRLRHTHPLLSFKVANPVWTEYEAQLTPGKAFEKKLLKLKHQFQAALEKDEAVVKKLMKDLLPVSRDHRTVCLRITISDANGYGISAFQILADQDEDYIELKPEPVLKALAKFSDAFSTVKSANFKIEGILNGFYNECAGQVVPWFADVWNKLEDEHTHFDKPIFIQAEDDPALEIKTKKEFDSLAFEKYIFSQN